MVMSQGTNPTCTSKWGSKYWEPAKWFVYYYKLLVSDDFGVPPAIMKPAYEPWLSTVIHGRNSHLVALGVRTAGARIGGTRPVAISSVLKASNGCCWLLLVDSLLVDLMLVVVGYCCHILITYDSLSPLTMISLKTYCYLSPLTIIFDHDK